MVFEQFTTEEETIVVLTTSLLSPQVKIKEATGLPPNLSNFVFCQYTFWDQCESTVAAPVVDPDVPSPQSKDAHFTVIFSHCKVTIFIMKWCYQEDGMFEISYLEFEPCFPGGGKRESSHITNDS